MLKPTIHNYFNFSFGPLLLIPSSVAYCLSVATSKKTILGVALSLVTWPVVDIILVSYAAVVQQWLLAFREVGRGQQCVALSSIAVLLVNTRAQSETGMLWDEKSHQQRQ